MQKVSAALHSGVHHTIAMNASPEFAISHYLSIEQSISSLVKTVVLWNN